MTKKPDSEPGVASRLWSKIVDRALGTVVIALFAVGGIVLTVFWEAITDGRVIEKLGGTAGQSHGALAGRVEALERRLEGQALNNTVADWLAAEDWSGGDTAQPEQRLALFERDVGALAGRVEIAPQLCRGIEYTVRFCVADAACPSPNSTDPYFVLAERNHFNLQAANLSNWIIAASSEWQSGTLFDAAGDALAEKGAVEIALNKDGPGRLSARFKAPTNATSGTADYKVRYIYVDQAFDGVRQPCSTSQGGT